MATVELVDVTKRWGSTVVLPGVSLAVADGEFVVLLGPSGCGKTTSMRLVAGLETPTSGQVRIGQRVVNALEPKDRDVAMVFQGYGLYPNLNVFDNIAFPLRLRKVASAELERRVRQAAERVELGALLQRLPRELSGGQRQRVALGRAIVRQPAVFLMDEPLSNLDARLRANMRAHLKHLHHELRTTTLYVTHDQLEAMTLSDRVVVMDGGRIRQIGTPRAVYDEPADVFVAGFVGAPAMNLIDGARSEGHFVADGVRVPGCDGPERGDLVLGVRAEHLSLCPPDARAHLRAPVFSCEPTGDTTWVTVRVGERLVTARAPDGTRTTIGEAVGLCLSGRAHVFERLTGARLHDAA